MEHQTKSNNKAIFVALLANTVIALSKAAGAVYTGSTALTAEAIHSCADTLNQLLLLIGAKRSKRPPTQLHPLGHGREAYFWSLIVALLLFTMGGLFSIFEGIRHFKNAHPISPPVAMLILVVSAISEGFSLRVTLRQIKDGNKNFRWLQWFKSSAKVDLLVIFTEDSAALAGVAIAFVSVFLTWITGDHRWDSIGSVGVGIVLVVVAIALTNEIRSLLVGEAARKNYKRELQVVLSNLIPGSQITSVVALQTGPEEITLAYQFFPRGVSDVSNLIKKITQLKRTVKIKFPEVKRQFVSLSEETK